MSFVPDPSEVDPKHYLIGGKSLRKIWEHITDVDYSTWDEFLKEYNIDKRAQWDSKDMKK